MRIHFRHVKDALTFPVHFFVKATRPLPEGFNRALFGGIGLLAKGYYHLPGSHVRRTAENFAFLTDRANAREMYFDLVDNVVCAAGAFGRLMRHGPDAVAGQVHFDESAATACEEVRRAHGGGIFVVPHCAGAVLSATGFARRYPTVVLVRESRTPSRSAIMKEYFEKLGAELVYVRANDPMTVARTILRTLHEKKFIIGTTDLIRRKDDTIEVSVFGQKVPMPAWPARFSSRRKAPILPGFIHMEGTRLVLTAGTPYIESDIQSATQRWADHFEQRFRQHPSDWLFMFDKRWAKVIEAAAQVKRAQAPAVQSAV